jgi:hypothetical protein
MVAVVLATAGSASARIKLATLPVRERVEIQLENETATLVEEERTVTLLKDSNEIDFSWTNTQIDKYTILFRPLAEGVRVIHQSYPPGENALVWEVFAEKAGPVKVRISYILGNLRRTFSYRATAEKDEKSLTLRTYMRVWNFSGEEFGLSSVWAGFGDIFQKEMGLQESKEVLVAKFTPVPIQKKFVFNWRSGQHVPEEPNQRYVTMQYVLKNVAPKVAPAKGDEASALGRFPLPFGKVRIFLKSGKDDEAFTGEDWGQFTPIDDEMKLYLGLARDIKVERTVKSNQRHEVHGNLFHQEVVVQYKMQNFKKDACTLDIEEDMNALRDEFCGGGKSHEAQWELADQTTDKGKVERKSAQKVEIHVELPAAPGVKGDAVTTKALDPKKGAAEGKEAASEKPKEVIFLVHLWFRNEW